MDDDPPDQVVVSGGCSALDAHARQSQTAPTLNSCDALCGCSVHAHVKVFANTAHVATMGNTPHHVVFSSPDVFTVNELKQQVCTRV